MPTLHSALKAGVLKAGVLSSVLLASACAHAALIEYTSRAAFDTATTMRSMEPNQAPPNNYYFLGGQNFNGIQYPGFAYMIDAGYTPSLYEWGSGPVLLLASQSTLSFAPVTALRSTSAPCPTARPSASPSTP